MNVPLYLLCMILGTLVGGYVGLVGGIVAAFAIEQCNKKGVHHGR